MAYIWENYSEEKRFRVGTCISPYLEIAFPDGAGGDVNPLLRFSEIFQPLEELPAIAQPDCPYSQKEELENILFHYLAGLDRLRGLDEKQIRVNALEREIMAGSFGALCAEHWRKLTEHDQRAILYTLAERFENETAEHWFSRAAQRLWGYVSILYEPATELYYVYICARETEYTAILMDVVMHLFWDMRCNFRITWLYHYGVIGADDSMRISEIQIV